MRHKVNIRGTVKIPQSVSFGKPLHTVSRHELMTDTHQHMDDVAILLDVFRRHIEEAGIRHDTEKLANFDDFHKELTDGFVDNKWYLNHVRTERHHLNHPDGIPEDVNLIDVLEYIADCTAAGKARSGEVRPIAINSAVLMEAFLNTCQLLLDEIK